MAIFHGKVSGNERSLPRFHFAAFDQKVLYLAFARCVLKVQKCTFKKGDAQRWCALNVLKSTKVKKCEKAHGPRDAITWPKSA